MQRPMGSRLALLLLLALLGPSGAAIAQAPPADDPGVTPPQPPSLNWIQGPGVGKLGDQAQVEFGASLVFLEGPDARAFLEALGNPTKGNELGIVLYPGPEDQEGGGWFVVFDFAPIGFVEDEDKDDLDPDDILDSIREGTEAANEERRRRGWTTVEVVGWVTEPFYDEASNNLTWAILGRAPEGDSVNYNTRLLGRHGVMSATLITDPKLLDQYLPAFNEMLKGYRYNEGNSYAEYRQGDKIAEYGLIGLVAGGAAAVALKAGFFKKFWKLIVAGVVALGAAVKKLFSRSS